MTRQELVKLLQPSLGQPPRLEVREAIGAFLRGEVAHIYVNYDWVKDWEALRKVVEHEGVEFREYIAGMDIYAEFIP